MNLIAPKMPTCNLHSDEKKHVRYLC